MRNPKRYIGFDLGAESGRCVVATLDEGRIVLDEVHRFTTHNTRDATGFHWQIGPIAEEIIEGLRQARASFGSKFEAIGIDTWGVDYVLIDCDGRVLGDPYHYRDDRTDGMMDEAFKIIPREELYSRTGTQFAQFNTVFQLLAEVRNNGAALRASDKMLLMPDYLNYVLTGAKKSEFTIASTTGLTDPAARDWDRELIREFGLPGSIFADVVEPGTNLGRLLPTIADRTGLDHDVMVIASAGHDTASAVAAIPATGDKWAFLSSGTWSLMGVELREPNRSANALDFNFTNEGGVDRTTRFLKNILGLWPLQECRREWASTGSEYSYDQLVGMARSGEPAGAWVDLQDTRFLKPDGMPEKVEAYLNETHQRAERGVGFIVRIIVESLAFSYKSAVEEIEKITGGKIDILHAVGGGIQNEFLMQCTADAIGKPVYAGPTEGAIVGNVGVLAVSTGAVRDITEWRKVVADSFEPRLYRPADSEYYLANEEKYASILRKSYPPGGSRHFKK